MKRETYIQRYLKGLVRNTKFGVYWRGKIRAKRGKLFDKNKSLDDLFPEVPYVKVKGLGARIPVIGIHKDPTELGGYHILGSYFLRYKRFLDFNSIPYKVVDLKRSDWIEQCKDLDILIVAYTSEPSRLNEMQAKTGILEQFHNVLCYPAAKDLWSYEDKVRVYYLINEYGFTHAKTFITHDYDEAMAFVKTAQYPLVSKIKTGSCSRGVELVKDSSRAMKIVKQSFGLGRRALWTYSFEKDYVYFQEFIHDATCDIRVFMVGDVIAGYHRRMKGDDFRASGAGLLDRRLFPDDVIQTSLAVKEKWDTTILAVDYVDTNNSTEHKIIEASISFGLDYPEYLERDGKRVFYVQTPDGLKLQDGCFWVQDFILLEMMRKWYKINESSVCLEWELVDQDKSHH